MFRLLLLNLICLQALPATTPSTMPATTQSTLDLSSPKATLETYRRALAEADAAAFRACVDVPATGTNVVDATARWIDAAKTLESSLSKRFGSDAPARMSKALGSICPQALAEQLKAKPPQITMDDPDHATAATEIGPRKLVRHESQWLLALSDGANAEERNDTATSLTTIADNLRRVAELTDQSQIKTIDDALTQSATPKSE